MIMTQSLKTAEAITDNTSDFFEDTIDRITVIKELSENDKESLSGNLVDVIYHISRASDKIDEVRKELNRLKDELANKVWADYLTKDLNSIILNNLPKSIKGTIALGIPKTALSENIPKKDTDDYFNLMTFLLNNPDVLSKDLVRIHWPSFMTFLNDIDIKGGELPPGIKSFAPKYLYNISTRKLIQND